MTTIFKNIYSFSVLFFAVLIIDIIIKIKLDVSIYRFISKSTVIILLFVYYLINQKEISKFKLFYVLGALLLFLIGDNLLILHETQIYYMIGISCFILGKMLYVFRFSNQRDFRLIKLFPIISICFVYMLGVFVLMQNNLNSYFYVILVYLFMALTVVVFALLRKNIVNLKSYYLVLIGVVCSIFSDSITGLKSFYDKDIAYHIVTIMLFYGLSQYFIILGIVKETNATIPIKNN